MYDIIMVGAGPAGSTLARLIGKDYKILLLEKRDFEKTHDYNRVKPCGGLIAPDAQLMLARFGLGVPKSVLMSPQLFSVHVLDFDNSNEAYYQRDYINIDREGFDRWLAGLIPDQVEKRYNALYKDYQITDDGVEVRFIHEGKECREKARIIVGADGGFSRVRKQGFEKFPDSNTYVSIQEWFKTDSASDCYGAIFDREITDFYSWTIPKDEYLILGSAFRFEDDPHEKFSLLKEKLKYHGFKLENSVKVEGTHILRPSNSNQICTGDNKVALIGEAAGFISPSSAEGLSYAFRSSLALAKALKDNKSDCSRLYKLYTKSLLWNIRLKNMKIPAMYNRHLRNMIIKTGLMSVKLEKFY